MLIKAMFLHNTIENTTWAIRGLNWKDEPIQLS